MDVRIVSVLCFFFWLCAGFLGHSSHFLAGEFVISLEERESPGLILSFLATMWPGVEDE